MASANRLGPLEFFDSVSSLREFSIPTQGLKIRFVQGDCFPKLLRAIASGYFKAEWEARRPQMKAQWEAAAKRLDELKQSGKEVWDVTRKKQRPLSMNWKRASKKHGAN